MPDVAKLFDMITSSPPDSVEDLEGMLADTGYAEPTGVAGLEGEEMAGEEMEEEGVEEEGVAGPSLDDLLMGMEGEAASPDEGEEEVEEEEIGPAPAGMEGGAEGVSISVMRGNAAKNAFEKHKKKGKDEESE